MVLSGFEYLGTVAFAISGAMVGIRKEMDVFGIAVLAVTTAVGGGILRDVLVGHTPPTAFLDPTFTLLALVSAILTCVAHSWLVRITNVVQLCDAVGLGAFTAVGASLAITYELNTLYIMVFLGAATGIGGGVLRDVFAREIPLVFQQEIYALASIAGGVALYYAQWQLPLWQAMYLCFFLTLGIRLLCVHYNVHLPKVGRVTRHI